MRHMHGDLNNLNFYVSFEPEWSGCSKNAEIGVPCCLDYHNPVVEYKLNSFYLPM